MPASLQYEFEPIQLIRAVQLDQHLRSPERFHESVIAALRYKVETFPELADRLQEMQSERDPSARVLYRARRRLDAVGHLLERRVMAFLADHPEELESIHLYSDGSEVKGQEIQGMAWEFELADGTLHKSMLAPLSLHKIYERPF